MKSSTTLLIGNTLSFAAVLYSNYLFGSGAAGERSVGEVSTLYTMLITPAGYAFSIWGLIYLLLLGFLAFQWVAYLRNDANNSLQPCGIWFLLSNIFNCTWIFLWVNLALGWSVLVIFGLLISLIAMLIQLESYSFSTAWRNRMFIHLPIGVYLGWIILATTLNMAVWLQSTKTIGVSSPENWVLPVVITAVAVYLFLLYQHNRKEPALVGVWGFVAIAVSQWNKENSVVWISLTAAVVLLVLAITKQVNGIRKAA
ncbi:MAG: tryptophan-rich sensory protein [Lunatimonas sp.]|uniref:tryptophan-rich sensory protein n=1 Tax=Lunatimonas sp. TaxID=2060141 RepID=UPI00263A6C56|nr:tryptophan-rich sensory protein [Lunatimonas sp.]MCC5938109.1 tryptophan-rich sensory protein [Lunatimonas sp.]